jgi:hypothetical protein
MEARTPICKKEEAMQAPDQSISEQSVASSPWNCRVIAWLILLGLSLCVCLIGTYFLLLKPLVQMVRARNWVETPCVIVSGDVVTQHGSENDTYKVHVVFSYSFDGPEKRQSERYSFATGSSRGYASKARVVAQYPRGRETVCYVNPGHPDEAVLNRGYDSSLLLGLIPLALALICGGIILRILTSDRRERRHLNALQVTSSDYSLVGIPQIAGEKTFVSNKTRWQKFIVLLVIALAWNGFVLGVSRTILGDLRTAPGGWHSLFTCGMGLFMIPFLLVGLLLAVLAVFQGLALFNPRVCITFPIYPLAIGGASELVWEISGKVSRIKNFRLFLEGREEATYTRGTRIVTDKSVFKTIPICEMSQNALVAQGRITVQIPDGTMHSFKSKNNKIIWELKAKGDIPRWPDIEDDYPVEILPAGAMGERA